jgi:hypothetical protein
MDGRDDKDRDLLLQLLLNWQTMELTWARSFGGKRKNAHVQQTHTHATQAIVMKGG